MAHQCAICGRGRPLFGNSVSFSQRHTRRRWQLNVQQVTVQRGDRAVRMRVCTRCLRTLAKTRKG